MALVGIRLYGPHHTQLVFLFSCALASLQHQFYNPPPLRDAFLPVHAEGIQEDCWCPLRKSIRRKGGRCISLNNMLFTHTSTSE
jgi:hypothetical protein